MKPVLYEIKAIPESGRAQLHITANQVQKYYYYRQKEDILWKLVGVTPEEVAYDLTAQMEALYNNRGLFEDLNQNGFVPKGFTLNIKPKDSMAR